jgi:hypothetical protein
MKEVWKYILPNKRAYACLQIPKGAQILRVDSQHNEPVMWVLVDPSAPKEACDFEVVLTGSAFSPGGYSYVGTAQLDGGSFVVHVFEVKP